MRTLYLWLTGILLLTLVAFFAVFKPITFTARQDPSDAKQFLSPLFVDHKSPDVRPQPTYTLPAIDKVYLYKPTPDLRLGLDLRGGIRLVMKIPNRAEFTYKLEPKLTTQFAAAAKQKAILDALSTTTLATNDTANLLQVVVSETAVNITTNAEDEEVTKDHAAIINGIMDKVVGAGKYAALKPETSFKAVGEAEQTSVLGIMEKRLNPDGLMEVIGYKKGTDQVVIEIPGVKDPEAVLTKIKTLAMMEFRLIPPDMSVSSPTADGGEVTVTRGGVTIEHKDAINASYLVLPGKALTPTCSVEPDGQGGSAVKFSLAEAADRERFRSITGANIGRQLAIVLDGKIITAPVIRDALFDGGIISGGFENVKGDKGAGEARSLATLLNAGALPVPVQLLENRTVSATLGADSVALSLQAGLIGLLAVLVFMFIYYRLPGVMANCALIIYVMLLLAMMKFFNATLTLPGIAGIIISIGMAVDANVIIFERLKEELRTNKPLDTAIDVAFARAWTAILDSNVASLITGGVLWMLGTGAVKGFAITLVIGVAVSMFTAVTVTRLFMKLLVRSKVGHNLAMYGI